MRRCRGREMDRKRALLAANECQAERMPFAAKIRVRGGLFINPSLDLGCIVVSSGSRDIINDADTMALGGRNKR